MQDMQDWLPTCIRGIAGKKAMIFLGDLEN